MTRFRPLPNDLIDALQFYYVIITKNPTTTIVNDDGIMTKMLYEPTQSVGFNAHPTFINSNAVITDTGVQKL
jgi:hypothetical protein